MMKKGYMLTLSLIVLLCSMTYARFGTAESDSSNGVDPTKIYGVRILWNNSMTVRDIAVSEDGCCIVIGNNTGLYYFAYNDSTPKWWYLPQGAVFSVAISANGSHVAAGLNSGYLHYFDNATSRVGEQSNSTWTSDYLGGAVDRGTIDMSDDGEYVAAGGTGPNVFYYANCTQREGINQNVTWGDSLWMTDILAVHLSPNGAYLAVGGANSSHGFVAYYTNSTTQPYPTEPLWCSWSSINASIGDLALSDDGYAVVAVNESVYYWANATTLLGDPNATWVSPGSFWSVDMSADGDKVVAGSAIGGSLHFWSNATMHEGVQAEDWVKLEFADVHGVAISDDGSVIAASARGAPPTNSTAYFLKADATMIDEFALLQYAPIVSMSGDGYITGMGGSGPGGLYVFELLEDSTPPLIDDVYQIPAGDSVYPDDNVTVYANVTDELSRVEQVILGYTTDGETWFIVNMTNPTGNQYNGTIPEFPYCTNVTYVITAIDNYTNTITTAEMGYEYRYHVIPEFALQMILPLFIAATLLIPMFRKRKFRGYTLKT